MLCMDDHRRANEMQVLSQQRVSEYDWSLLDAIREASLQKIVHSLAMPYVVNIKGVKDACFTSSICLS